LEVAVATRAPVALFAFNRPEHLAATLRSLAANAGARETDVEIFLDGPRSRDDEAPVRQARAVARAAEFQSCFKSLTFVERETNFGLARSIVEGVSAKLRESESVIVVEDDLVTAKHFLDFVNGGLATYADAPQVMCIHGYAYPIDSSGLPETYFLRGADCWGWGTWRRAWAHFNPDGRALLDSLRREGMASGFDVDDSYPFMQMLEQQIAGKNDSWAIRWRASAYLKGGLTLYPRESLVRNIGFDSSGRHSGTSDFYDVDLARTSPAIQAQPLEQNAMAYERLARYFRNATAPANASQKLKRFLQGSLKRLGVGG
jgi:GT2 family glycosyltransferase